MTSLPANRAKTLTESYRACEVKPLTGENMARYYVDLSAVGNTEAIEGVSRDLDIHEPGEFDTILFTGDRGCGKTRELKRIQSQCENKYRVIYREFDWERGVNDAEYSDIYFVCVKKIADDLTELRLKFDPKLLESFESWFKDVTEETEATVQSSVSLNQQRVDVSAIFADRQQLLDLVKARGAHVRQLMQVTRSACRTAITRKHSKVLAENVTYALKQQQFDFEKSTPGSEYYTKLPEVGIEKEITKKEIGQNLLFNLAVVEYNGKSRWNYVNPLVK
jgi:Cdc6-like AAA superfamily ATPase